MFHMQADGLMFGALGALQQGHERFERIYCTSDALALAPAGTHLRRVWAR